MVLHISQLADQFVRDPNEVEGGAAGDGDRDRADLIAAHWPLHEGKTEIGGRAHRVNPRSGGVRSSHSPGSPQARIKVVSTPWPMP